MKTRESGTDEPSLLCVANYEAGTGFAWSFIERLYADVARRLEGRGIRTWVAYPGLPSDPDPLRDSPARAVELPVHLGELSSLREVVGFVRRRNVRVVYLADRATWHPGHLALRAAGVRWIVVHDHTSGTRTRPTGAKFALKWLSRRVPGTTADRVIGVSDFVARRKVVVDLVPAERVVRIWNAIEVPSPGEETDGLIADRLGLPEDRPVVACACRAAEEKGVDHLLRAFARVLGGWSASDPAPRLLYMGDGPVLGDWQELARRLGIGEDVTFTGYRDDADELVGDADLAVVPSVWAEAFGLAALEPMARGVPVVASRVGGLPEVVADGETGILVPPRDEEVLAETVTELLVDDERRREMGRKARTRVQSHFAWEEQVGEIARLLEEGFA